MRNAHRRDNAVRNRKAVFIMRHLEISDPEMFKEADALYEYINKIYPCKHDLTRTELYKKTVEGENLPLIIVNNNAPPSINEATTSNNVQASATTTRSDVIPVLNIVNNNAPPSINEATTSNNVQASATTTRSDVIPVLNIPLIDVQIKIPQENQSSIESHETDPPVDDLFPLDFNNDETEMLMNTLMEDPDLRNFFNEIEVPNEEIRPMTVDEEIDMIIKEQIKKIDDEFNQLIGL